MLTWWVYIKKHNIKRLIGKGFQDPKSIRIDSPISSKEFCVTLVIMASNGWKINSVHIKITFLHRKHFKINVYLSSPSEVHYGMIWTFKIGIYGLNDAARMWYLTVKQTLIQLQATMLTHDEAFFTWHSDDSRHFRSGALNN